MRIPRLPRKVDAATLEKTLRDEGFPIHRRTIQRDLLALSEVFPLVCDERTKPYGWSWAFEAAGLTVATMAPHTALLFKLAAEVLHPLLPADTLRFVRAHLRVADGVLAGSASLRAWAVKLAAQVERRGPSSLALLVKAVPPPSPRRSAARRRRSTPTRRGRSRARRRCDRAP